MYVVAQSIVKGVSIFGAKKDGICFFGNDPHKRAQRIFNIIAPVYSALDGHVKRGYARAMRKVRNEVDLTGKSVLDIGTGTGAWAALFKEQGAGKVHGIDFAEKMLRKAKQRYGKEIIFSVADARTLHDFADHSFDIVTASFVLHGVKEAQRRELLLEMKCIAREYLIINDYYGPTPAFMQFLEHLEKSDYKHFKEHFMHELKAIFPYVKMEHGTWGTAVYFASDNHVI